MKGILVVVMVSLLLASPLALPGASAADVNQTLIAKTTAWHVGSADSTSTQITLTVGDTVHLSIENQEPSGSGINHTFTAPHFAAASGQIGGGTTLNVTLPVGDTFVWNYTLTSSDVGTWQFYCIPHSGGTYPNRAGMVGSIVVQAAKATPGFEVSAVVAAIVAALVVVRVARRRR